MTHSIARAAFGWRAVAAGAVALGLAACASAPEEVAVDPAATQAAAAAAVDRSTQAYFESAVGDRVYFPTDQSVLTDDAKAVLSRQVEWLQANGAKRVRIEGHADERGTREYNIALGAKRADAVKAFLVSRGVSAERVETVSYGRERPVEVCSNDACWARNRRAVTVPR